VDVNTNWWQDFFEGVAVTTWLDAIPLEQTRREADRLKRLLALPAAAEVLDVPCGAGRLATVLAGDGYRVSGVDWSTQFLARARDGSPNVAWEQRDMRDLPWAARFDGAFCVGNSFGYLDDEGNAAFVRAVAAALKPGGRFILETPMVTENLLDHLQPRPWWKLGDVYLLAANHYDPARSRLDIEYTFVADGRVETRRGSHRAYSYRELMALLTNSGFTVELAEPWSRDAHVVTCVATRDSS
jgi:SAM-dependent methyltransferase